VDKKNELLLKLQDVLQTDKILFEDTILAGLEEWDSLAVISTIALFDAEFGIVIPAQEIVEAKTISEIFKKFGL